MKRTVLLITLLLLSVVLLTPGIAGAQISKDPYKDILNQLKKMQTQLDNIQKQTANLPPTWSRQLPASERFVVLADFNNEAVLDKETGLVWERSPSRDTVSWEDSVYVCNRLELGGRYGWHLPTIEQLSSLVDRWATGVKLPAGHPFDIDCSPIGGGCVRPDIYWTATSCALYGADSFAYIVNFGASHIDCQPKLSQLPGPTPTNVWCVRGEQTYDAY